MSKLEEKIPLPEPYSRRKLAELYRELPISDEIVKLLRQYLKAMSNLYGLIPMDKVYEIIDRQNPGFLTKSEFADYVMVARHEQEYFTIAGEADLHTGNRFHSLKERDLIDNLLLCDHGELLQTVCNLQADKPYYIPEKKILLRYRDEFYTEPTPQTKAMKRYLRDVMSLDETRVQEVFDDLIFIIRQVDSNSNILSEYMERAHLSFPAQKAVEEFFELYQQLHNHTRMQCNRGHTPDEVFFSKPPEERMPKSFAFGPNIRRQLLDGTMNVDEMIEGLLTMEMPSEELRQDMLRQLFEIKKEQSAQRVSAVPTPSKAEKVGRNDPCPCGSGKKYKKCCGR